MFARKILQALPQRQRGLTTVEYAIAGGLVAAGVILTFILIGDNVGDILSYISDELSTANDN